MNRNRNSLHLMGLVAAILGGFPMPMQRQFMPRRPGKASIVKLAAEESARRIEAAQAKRARRCARNLALLRAAEARKVAA